MAKIEELSRAKNQLEQKKLELAYLVAEADLVQQQAERIKAEYLKLIEPYQSAADQALDAQNKTLGPWVYGGAGKPANFYTKQIYHYRYPIIDYAVDSDGNFQLRKDKRCFSNAWLRHMPVSVTGSFPTENKVWQMTLNWHNSPTSYHQAKVLGKTTNECFDNADQILRDNGWNLID